MITLIHDLVIRVDKHNYTLMLDRHKQDKKGEPIYETLGYFGTLDMVPSILLYLVLGDPSFQVFSRTECPDWMETSTLPFFFFFYFKDLLKNFIYF